MQIFRGKSRSISQRAETDIQISCFFGSSPIQLKLFEAAQRHDPTGVGKCLHVRIAQHKTQAMSFQFNDKVAGWRRRCLNTIFCAFCNLPFERCSQVVILVTSWDCGMLTLVKLLFRVQPVSTSICFCNLNRQTRV